MFFEDSDSQDRDGEVRISATEKDSSKDDGEDRSKLEKEAESKLLGSSSGDSETTGSTGGVTIEDVHEQNERIIELLEELNDDDSSKSSSSRQASDDDIGGAAADGLL